VRLKEGVIIKGAQPELVLGLMIVQEIFRKNQLELTITSALDGHHMEGSLHKMGLAVDIRIRDIAPELRSVVLTEMKVCLGRDFDVVLEDDHIHFEVQPKG